VRRNLDEKEDRKRLGRIEEAGTVDEKGDWKDISIFEYAGIYTSCLVFSGPPYLNSNGC
jgi:hypothetical protein